MNDSFQIGRLFGIPIRLHWTFLILLYVFAVGSDRPLTETVVFLGGVCLAVLLHEIGHALVARRFGIQVVEITFWPLGGMTNMTRVPEDARIEGLIAAGGPVTNLVLAALSVPAWMLASAAELDGLAAASATFLGVNLLLGTLNLVPAFPMDGGRILRAWLARSRDWVSATEQAVRVSRFVLLSLIGFALLSPLLGLRVFTAFGTLCILPVMVLFLWYAGMRELMAVRLRHGRSPFGRAGAFRRGPGSFASMRWTNVDPERDVEHATGVRGRRGAHPPPPPPEPPEGGFSDEFVRRLERSHGRLRRRPHDPD